MTTRNDVKNKKLELKGKAEVLVGQVREKLSRPRESPIRSNPTSKTLART